MTKRQESIIERYRKSNYDELYKCYGRVSTEKIKAWERCKALCASHDGSGLRVIGHGSWQFSAGFKCEKDGKKVLCYITKVGIEYIPMND